MRIRALVAEDVTSADRVLQAAFGVERSFRPRLERYLSIQPDGWRVAEEGGDVVGTAGAIDYGSCAYVGLMAVRPDRQACGTGGRLLRDVLAWIDDRGIPCARLDATEAGARVYERAGFVDAGVTHELVRPAQAATTARREGSSTLSVALAQQPSELSELDRQFFGSSRTRVWERLLGEYTGRILVARTTTGERLGYLCVQEQVLGPWGAATLEAADALLSAAEPLLAGSAVRVLLPSENEPGRALLETRGFHRQKSLRHLLRGAGTALPGWSLLYGKGSYCLG